MTTPLQRVDLILASTHARQTFTTHEMHQLLDAIPETLEVLSARVSLQGQTILNRTQVRDLLLDIRQSAGSTALTESEAA